LELLFLNALIRWHYYLYFTDKNSKQPCSQQPCTHSQKDDINDNTMTQTCEQTTQLQSINKEHNINVNIIRRPDVYTYEAHLVQCENMMRMLHSGFVLQFRLWMMTMLQRHEALSSQQ